MKRSSLVSSFIVMILLTISGCSVEIPASPPPISPAPASPVRTFTAAPLPNLNATPTLSIPQQTSPATAVPTPVPLNHTWAGLKLTGRLLYNTVDSTQYALEIHILDLATGNRQIIFHLPDRTWTDAVTVSPDYKTLLLAYSAPQPAPYAGQESIYTMPVDGSSPPQLLVTPPSKDDQYSQPVWSPDGTYIYFAHLNYATMDTYEIMRMAFPNGQPEKFIDHAYWPRVSLDGKHFSFVALDADTGKNHLYLANIDGSDAHEVSVKGLPVPQIIDVPMISPDNRLILFSSPDGIKAFEPNWIDTLFGVQVVHADGTLPSDWWSVPIGGGTAKSLTQLQSLALYGAYSPDRQWIASYSSAGIFVMKPDGTKVTMIVNDIGGIVGTVNWLP
jgi:Tol biopolymer transport system component